MKIENPKMPSARLTKKLVFRVAATHFIQSNCMGKIGSFIWSKPGDDPSRLWGQFVTEGLPGRYCHITTSEKELLKWQAKHTQSSADLSAFEQEALLKFIRFSQDVAASDPNRPSQN